MKAGESNQCDVVIAGGGMVGMILGLALSKAGVHVTVVESSSHEANVAPAFDGRVSSFSPSSVRMLKALDLWSGLAPLAEPILRIVVGEGDHRLQASGAFLEFGEAEQAGEPLAHMIENRHFRSAVFDAQRKCDHFDFLAPCRIADVQVETTGMRMETDAGVRLSASVLVAAEGKNSSLRDRFGLKTTSWDYHQSAIVTTIKHEVEHHGVASEVFLPGGPFAILPMTGKRSSIVWSEPSASVGAYMALENTPFLSEVECRFGDHLGALDLEGPRWTYPLSLQMAHRYVLPRFALIGDAAHVVHPLAGQGLNLGLRDAAVLAEVIVDAIRLGLDIGSLSVLERYESARRFDNYKFAATMEMFNRLFSNANPMLTGVRRAGMDFVNLIQPLKRSIIGQASEPSGVVPRLMRGLAL